MELKITPLGRFNLSMQFMGWYQLDPHMYDGRAKYNNQPKPRLELEKMLESTFCRQKHLHVLPQLPVIQLSFSTRVGEERRLQSSEYAWNDGLARVGCHFFD